MEKLKIIIFKKLALYFFCILCYYKLERTLRVDIMTNLEAKKYLEQVLDQLKKETPTENLDNFEERFNESREVLKFENNYIYVIVKDPLTKLLIEKFNSRRMNEF